MAAAVKLDPYLPIPNRINGLDISSVQRNIDMQAVKDAGFDFIYIQSSRYSSTKESLFPGLLEKARKAGLVVGAYHFFSPTSPPDKQAEFFFGAAEGLGKDPGDLPPMLDWENEPTCKRPNHKSLCVKEIQQFANKCKELWYPHDGLTHNPRYPTIYTYPYYATAHQPALAQATELDYFPLTYASYTEGLDILESRIPAHPLPKPWTEWTLCQFKGNEGRARGCPGPVDRLLFRGNHEEFQAFRGLQ